MPGMLERESLRVPVGAAALLFSVAYFASDAIEAAQGGFSTGQLWLTLVAEAAIPFFVVGLYLVQRPAIVRLGAWGAYGYAAAYAFFVWTVIYPLIHDVPDFDALSDVFGIWLVLGGALMVFAGLAFVLGARRLLPPERGFLGRRGPDASASGLVFLVLFVHSLPEGFAVGSAFASDRAGLSLFVILAIAIQNVPEGTSIALPMHDAGFGAWRQFWVAVATSLPQPVGAVIAWAAVEAVGGLLPFSFAFAAGAMLTIVAIEMAPRALAARPVLALIGALAGGATMAALSLALGV
jgi:ZIP family zinc transporter